MKDVHFNNMAAFVEEMIRATGEVHVDDEAFVHIFSEVFEPMFKRLEYHRDSIDREVDGGVKTIDLLYDGVDDPTFEILPGEAVCVIRRIREVKRLRKLVDAQLKPRNESAHEQIHDMLFGENGLIAALLGKKPELAEPPMENRVEISERFLKIYETHADVQFGELNDNRLIPLAISYGLCSEERDRLEHKAEVMGTELEGSDAERYANLLTLLDELRSKASDYLSKNPDFDLFDTGVFEFPEES